MRYHFIFVDNYIENYARSHTHILLDDTEPHDGTTELEKAMNEGSKNRSEYIESAGNLTGNLGYTTTHLHYLLRISKLTGSTGFFTFLYFELWNARC